MRALCARGGGLGGALRLLRGAGSALLPTADGCQPLLGPCEAAKPPLPSESWAAAARQASPWDRPSKPARGFASGAGGSGPEDTPPVLTGEELASLEALFYEMCGQDATPPPDLDELTALAELKRKHDAVYGPGAVPTMETMFEMGNQLTAELTGKRLEAEEPLDLDGSSSSSSSDSDSDSEAEGEADAPALQVEGVELWEDYKLTPKDLEQVKATMKLPRKLQKSIMQQDLKALLRRQQEEGEGDGDADDERAQERIFDMRTVSVQRTCKKNKGGGLFRFQAFVVVGNGDGVIGYGMGKAGEVLSAIDKAYQDAERNLYYVERYRGHTVFEATEGKCTKTRVRVWPRPSGSGISCNNTLANICALAGIEDLGAKCHGSRHRVNMVKAFFQALEKQRTPEEIAREKGLVAREVAGALR
mmetsp:Transcript_35779/g.91362  ORF Transcript_35779/g.91362 Transcript_35779/m.91362 type:complete len:418 (+) Transcript_35779:166-1419(+)|eukprot:jgi/Tetstr1/428945/TSEL_018920.t1